MKTFLLLILIVIGSECTEESLNLMISQTSDEMLKTSLLNLVGQLSKINTTAQNNYLLSNAINDTYNSLVYMTNEISSTYNNIIFGSNDTVVGNNNIILGSYDTIVGSGNYVFVPKYTGEISGDLVIMNWRIQLDMRNYTMTDPNRVVFPLSSNETLFYSNYQQKYQPPAKYVLSLVQNIVNMVNTVEQSATTQLPTQQIYPNSVVSSVVPEFVTPINNGLPSTQNLRTDSASTTTNSPFTNLSQSLFNKSWLPF